MLKTILSHIDIYTDTVQTIKLPLEEYRLKIFESFVLGRRLQQDPRNYGFTDYTVPMIQHFSFFHQHRLLFHKNELFCYVFLLNDLIFHKPCHIFLYSLFYFFRQSLDFY